MVDALVLGVEATSERVVRGLLIVVGARGVELNERLTVVRGREVRVVALRQALLDAGILRLRPVLITVGATVSQTAVVSHPEVIARLPLLVAAPVGTSELVPA